MMIKRNLQECIMFNAKVPMSTRSLSRKFIKYAINMSNLFYIQKTWMKYPDRERWNIQDSDSMM